MKGKSIQMVLAISAISALLFVASSGLALAKKPVDDPQGDSPLEDFDIRSYGFAGKKAYVQVYGHAGRTLAGAEDQAVGYVIFILNKDNEPEIWAIDTHEREHSGSGVGIDWHSQLVSLTGENNDCLNEVGRVGGATVNGKRATFEGLEANEITGAATVRLQVLVDDPDNPPPGTECIAKVIEVFDTA